MLNKIETFKLIDFKGNRATLKKQTEIKGKILISISVLTTAGITFKPCKTARYVLDE